MPAQDPTESVSQANLQNELHSFTREQHMRLNQKIIARLPLCLPPCSADPTTYIMGMTIVGQIYFAFENAWLMLLEDKEHKICSRQRQILRQLQTANIERSQRLRHDIGLLRCRLSCTEEKDYAEIENKSLSFNKRIQDRICSRPHVTLAYAWCMYLALFNGGRWLLKQLQSPGATFWLEDNPTGNEESAPTAINALSFWAFDSSLENAEDIKLAFKANFDSAAELLTSEERTDAIAESKAVFEICEEMVDELDQIMQTRSAELSNSPGAYHSSFTAFASSFIQPLSRVWQTFNSTAATYLWTRAPQPLREEIHSTA